MTNTQSQENESQASSSSGQAAAKQTRKNALRDIAAGTLDAIKHGSYLDHDLTRDLSIAKQNTRYYAPNSLLSTWASSAPSGHHDTSVSLLEVSTLEGARLLANTRTGSSSHTKIGILNFASAKKPGGGFINGAQAQEESIARSSTLYPTLMTRVAQEFYTTHNRDPKGGYYSHAMIYSPNVVVFRDDQGGWVEPLAVDVLTSAAVNAGVVRQTLRGRLAGQREVEARISATMEERMARILFLFESQGAKDIVLGSFGTGVFRNDIATVAGIWTKLLFTREARFKRSFENIVFAVLGRDTFATFEEVFAPYGVTDSR